MNRRRILTSLVVIGVVGAVAGASTTALFSDQETSQGNEFTAGELDLLVDWKESYNGEQIDEQEMTNNPGSIFTHGDLKPGDYGEATISLHLEDNPGWIWMKLDQTSNWDNSCTEPEHKAEKGNCGSEGELDEELEFVIWADDGDNVLEKGENIIFEGTAEELEEQSVSEEGVLLDGNYSTDDVEAFPGDETGYIGVKWELPKETGNRIQGDSVSYDVTFYTEQKRHNENPDNPWTDEPEEKPENEPPVASFERANGEPFQTTVDNEVRLFSTSTDDDEIVKNKWNMGDGTTKFGIDVRHAWEDPGNYTVSLEVTDSDGETDTATRVMQVTGEPDDSSCQEPVDSSKEYTADEISQAKYGYDFEDLSDETKCEVEDLFNNQPFAEGLGPGDVRTKDEISQDMFNRDYSELSSDSKADVDESYMNQFAEESTDEDPEAIFTAVAEGNDVTFNASNSTDDNGIASYEWDFGDDSTGSGEIVEHTYEENGTYTAELTVTDTAGNTDSATVELQIGESDDPDGTNGTEYTAIQGDQTIQIEPLEGEIPVEELYDFRLPDRFDNQANRDALNGATYPGSGPYYGSVGTESLQQGDTSIMFLYDGPNGLSFVVVHEGTGSNDGGSTTWTISDMPEGQWVVKDDLYFNDDGTKAGSNYDDWVVDSEPQVINWTWGGGGTDGGAYRDLGDSFSFTIDPAFNEESPIYEEFYNGDVDDWQVLSGNMSNPERTSLDLTDEVTVEAQ